MTTPAPVSVAEVVAFQADACGRAGSPLYERLLRGIVDDVSSGGVTAGLLAEHAHDPFGSALALRFLGVVHRIALEGRAPALADLYPSTGGDPTSGDLVSTFLETVAQHTDEIRDRLSEPVQTNEVGRSAVLAGGFAAVMRQTGLPLRLLEVGASAGLNLRFDRYAYDTGAQVGGDPMSPVRFTGIWQGRPPWLPTAFEVAARRGCDRNPLEVTSPEDRTTLRAFVWPDQVERLALLDAALEVAQDLAVPVDRADVADWTEALLDEQVAGTATVVFHSIVLQYVPPSRRRRFVAAIERAGGAATAERPLAWLRMEPAGDRAELRLTSWPGGTGAVLASAGYHGRPVWWDA